MANNERMKLTFGQGASMVKPSIQFYELTVKMDLNSELESERDYIINLISEFEDKARAYIESESENKSLENQFLNSASKLDKDKLEKLLALIR